MPRCLIALGSNLGDRADFLARAIARLADRKEISAPRSSTVHETPAIGGADAQRAFLNAAMSFDTTLAAEELHALLGQIEHALGRQRGQRWGPRTIDLDLLLYGDAVIDQPDLVVPHPRMAFRRFVLEPAAEVAAEMTHPVIGWSVRRLVDHRNTAANYVALLGLPESGKTALADRLAAELAGRAIRDPAVDDAPLTGSAAAAGPAYEGQIELIGRRAALLDRRHWPGGDVLAVSDFYFDECLAIGAETPSAREIEALRGAWQAAQAQVVLPKLLVVLDTRPTGKPAATAGAQPRGSGLRAEFLRLAARPLIGPVLYAGTDPQGQFLEISAAINAMR